jgi:hypothetical protein
LLAYPGLVLVPDLYGLSTRMVGQSFGYFGCEALLKSTWAAGSALGLKGRTERRR